MTKARRLLTRTFPRMDVVSPVRDFKVVTTKGATRVAAKDVVDALRAVDEVALAIYDLTPDPSRRVVAGAATKRKNGKGAAPCAKA